MWRLFWRIMEGEVAMPLTSFDYLKSRTNITEDLLLGPTPEPVARPTTDQAGPVWTSAERKRLHESYWGDLILKFVTDNLADFASFDQAWNATNFHEWLNGSKYGIRFARRKARWTAIFSREGVIRDQARLTHIPFLRFLYEGRVERISLRVLGLLRRQILGQLVAGMRPDATALFDLGSGWGRHALMFADQYPGLAVHAGEISEAGQMVTRSMADRFGLSVTSFAFDYLNWEDMAERVAAVPQPDVIVFSSHSIEQVTFVDSRMWERLAGLPKRVRFIHVEPVGWQLSGNAATIYSRAPKTSKPVRWGYNKNLLAVVDHLEAKGLIHKVQVTPDFIAFGKMSNSGTLVTFQNFAA